MYSIYTIYRNSCIDIAHTFIFLVGFVFFHRLHRIHLYFVDLVEVFWIDEEFSSIAQSIDKTHQLMKGDTY